MEKEPIPQPKLSKEAVLEEYFKAGFDPRYADFFWETYSSTYDDISRDSPYDDDNSDYALSTVKDGMPWYIAYHTIGHPKEWCLKAYHYGAYTPNRKFEFADYAECLREVYRDFIKEALENKSKEAEEAANAELKKNCDFIGRMFGKGEVYMRAFYDDHERMTASEDSLDEYDVIERAYYEAIEKGKDTDFAYYYGTLSADKSHEDSWRLAEVREQLQKEGRDDVYSRLYLILYSENLQKYGMDKEHPGKQAPWEKAVDAFMNAWEYVRWSGFKDFSEGKKRRFSRIYMDIYMNAACPDPEQGHDSHVLDIALRKFNGEAADYRDREVDIRERRIVDDILESMFPDVWEE